MATGHLAGTDGVFILMFRSQMSRHYPVSTKSSTVFCLRVVISEYINVYIICVNVFVCFKEKDVGLF